MKKTKAQSGEGSITYTMRNGRKYWTARITLGFDRNGEQIRRSYSSYKKSEVAEKLERIKAIQDVTGYATKGDEILGDCFFFWLFCIKAKEISSTTLARYDSAYRLRISKSAFSKIRVREINIMNLQRFIDEIIEKGGSGDAAKTALSLMRMFLDHAVVAGMLQTNPAGYVKLPKKEKSRRNQDTYRIFSKKEQTKIIDALRLDDPVEAMIYLDFFTGLRRGELRGLLWEDFNGKTLHVRKQLARQYTFKNGKRKMDKNKRRGLKTENAERTIALPQVAVNFLKAKKLEEREQHMRFGIPFSEKSFIFVDYKMVDGRVEAHAIEEKRATRRIRSICTRLGIDPKPLHAVRHSYATRLFEAGVDIKTVQHLMGHGDYQTTLNIYTHVMPEQKEKAVEIFDAMYL